MRSITIIIAFDLKSMIPVMSKAVFKKKKKSVVYVIHKILHLQRAEKVTFYFK